jgi:hypothetical protein
MKNTANVAAEFSCEFIRPVVSIRLPIQSQRPRPEIERTTMSKFTLSLWISLAVAMLVTAFMTMSMTASLGHISKQSAAPSAVHSPAVHSILMGNAAGHEITADIDTAGYIVDQRGAAGVEFLNHKLAIEKERLLLDGMEKAKISADARLKIVISDMKLSVMANGINAFHATIKR